MFNFRPIFNGGMLVLAMLVPNNVNAAQAETVSEVASGIYAFDPQDGYNSMFIVTDEGVIAIEPANSKHAAGLLEAIASVTEKPVKYLLTSHNHWDHANGGKIFQDAGAISMVHEEAAAWMASNPHKDLAQPDKTWNGKRFDLNLGGTTVELHYLGMNHGLGMTVFVLPKERIAYIADLAVPNRILFAIVPDFNIKEWQRSLGEIETLDFDKTVFSHSNSGSAVGGKAEIAKNREFISDLQGAIFAEFKKGTPFQKIPSVLKLPKYKDWAGYDEWLPMNVWRVLLDMWMGPFPWHPDASTTK
jgi:glyoxylase-like metal-dependent hydrolase (beta-lactamase superfamily II)